MSWLQNVRDGAPIQSSESRYEWNWVRFFISQVFWFMETAYFGWNMSPGSPEEMICDGMVAFMIALSVTRTSARR